jgi:hypothetical protein
VVPLHDPSLGLHKASSPDVPANIESQHREGEAKPPVCRIQEGERSMKISQSAVPVFNPDPNDATKCDLCGQRKESVRPRTLITVGSQSATVRTKFCDECAATVESGIDLPIAEPTHIILLEKPITSAQAEQVTQDLVEEAAKRDLPRIVEKYRAIENQTGKRVQVCIADYDETTYNFLHLGTGWAHSFWQMVNDATARKLRDEGFLVRIVNLDLDDYMEWLAQENLHDSSAARARFAAAIADREMGIKSEVRDEWYGDEASTEAPKEQVQTDMPCDLPKRHRRMRSTTMSIVTVAIVVVLTAFVAAYNSPALNRSREIAVAQSPEIRRAIPVESEISRAIPVQRAPPKIDRPPESMAFSPSGRARSDL